MNIICLVSSKRGKQPQDRSITWRVGEVGPDRRRLTWLHCDSEPVRIAQNLREIILLID